MRRQPKKASFCGALSGTARRFVIRRARSGGGDRIQQFYQDYFSKFYRLFIFGVCQHPLEIRSTQMWKAGVCAAR